MKSAFPLALLAAAQMSCAANHDTVCFTTRTVVGLSVEGSPQALDFGYARQELSIAPVTEDGQVLPLLASFTNRGGAAARLFGLGIGQSFAVGNAALALALFAESAGGKNSLVGENDGLFIQGGSDAATSRTSGRPLPLHEAPAAIPGKLEGSRLYVFGTNTLLGFEVGFEPAGGYPHRGTIGWRREEFAYVPIFERFDATGAPTHILVPSLVATTSAVASASQDRGSINITQFYATGLAAVFLSGLEGVRTVLGKELTLSSAKEAIDKDRAKETDRRAAVVRAKERIAKLAPDQLDAARQALFAAIPSSTDTGAPIATWPQGDDSATADQKRALLAGELEGVDESELEDFLKRAPLPSTN